MCGRGSARHAQTLARSASGSAMTSASPRWRPSARDEVRSMLCARIRCSAPRVGAIAYILPGAFNTSALAALSARSHSLSALVQPPGRSIGSCYSAGGPSTTRSTSPRARRRARRPAIRRTVRGLASRVAGCDAHALHRPFDARRPNVHRLHDRERLTLIFHSQRQGRRDDRRGRGDRLRRRRRRRHQ